MIFKGVYREGPKSGDIIEFSAEEKVPVALQLGAIDHDTIKDKLLCWTADVSITSLNFFANGKLLRDMWQNNIYRAEGVATFKYRRFDNALRPAKQMKFFVEFHDCLDYLRLPDLKVDKLVLEPAST
jgi:hypothetical protein